MPAWKTCTLLLVMTVWCSAQASLAAADAPLRVATFCCDVTPPVGSPLVGGYNGPTVKVEHPLWAKGIVLDDGRQRCVLCAVDWCGLGNSSFWLFGRKIAEAAGTEPSRVAVQCLHQHTAPLGDTDAQELIQQVEDPIRIIGAKFLEEVVDRLAAAVRKSLEELQPFDSVGTGRAKVERVASSRRISVENGKFRWRMSSTRDPELQALPEGYIDPLLKTITLARGEKPLVRLHYYATHPQSFYGDGRVTSDVPGLARERLQQKENVFQIYFTGCGGDVAMGKYNDATPRARDELTDRLYAGMEAAVASTKWEPAPEIEWRTVPLLLPLRTDGRFSIPKQRAVMENPKATGAARIDAALYLAFAQRIEKPIELGLLKIGRVHVLHLPGEPMVEFQLFAQRVMPGQFVAVAGYGDYAPCYVCTEQAYADGGHEPSEAWAAPRSEAVLKKAIRRLLRAE